MKSALRIIGALLLCASGIGVTSLAITRFVTPRVQPQRDTGMPREKLRELAALAPEVDVLVIGTSRLLHGFDPRVFERETRKLGRPLRAYNLSLQRLLLWEQAQVLDDALALPRLKPRLVLLEPAVGLGISPENFTHARTIEFETPAAWRLATSSVLGSDRSPAHKAWNIATHTIVAGLHVSNYGLYTDVVFPERGRPERVDSFAIEWRGFEPKKDLRQDENPPDWLKAMAAEHAVRHPRDAADAGPLPAPMRAHFEALRAKLAARGITLVFVQPPQLGFTTEELRTLTYRFPRALQSSGGAPVLSFLNPAAHPALFEPRWWVDYNHVTETGARLFTTELARELVQPRGAAIAR